MVYMIIYGIIMNHDVCVCDNIWNKMMNHDWLGSFMFFQSAFIYRVMTGKKKLTDGRLL